jgi:hypothetical protein
LGILRDVASKRFWRRLVLNVLAAAGALATVLGTLDVFLPGIFVRNLPVILGCVVASIGFGIFRSRPRPIRETYGAPATSISLIRGDLFEQQTHVVVGTCDTFDTAEPHIAAKSVQGQFLERIYRGDAARLDAAIDKELDGLAIIESVAKAGKTRRYALGSVVTLRHPERNFYLVAYSRMDEVNNARATTDGLWNSLSNLWATVRASSNGETVSIPLIGGGQSKVSQVLHADDSVRFIILSFLLASREAKVAGELRIVARPEEFDRLDHLELQAFLSAMRTS